MADDPNQIGQVSVKVVASGVEETNKKLDSVAEYAKEVQASINGTGAAGVGASVPAASEETPLKATNVNKTTAAFGGLKNELRQIFGIISGISIGAAILMKLTQGAIAFKNAARDISNELREIDDGFKINTSAGQSSFDKLTEAANEFHEKEKRRLDDESSAGEEYWRRFVAGQFRILRGVDSDVLANKKKQNDADLESANQQIVAHEKNASELRIRNNGRELELTKAKTSAEKIQLQEKFDLEDAHRNRASALERSDSIKDQNARNEAQRQIQVQGAAEDASIHRLAAARLAIAQREEAYRVREFQNQGAAAAIRQFGPGSNDQNTLILQNIAQTNRYLVAATRRF